MDRGKYTDPADVRKAQNSPGAATWERALAPQLRLPRVKRLAEATFTWIIRPEGGWLEGCVYTDGAALDGPLEEFRRCAWAFVALDSSNRVVAAARGVAPGWVDDIGGAEAWALLQAGQHAMPGSCQFVSDSLVTVMAIHGGFKAATHARKK